MQVLGEGGAGCKGALIIRSEEPAPPRLCDLGQAQATHRLLG